MQKRRADVAKASQEPTATSGRCPAHEVLLITPGVRRAGVTVATLEPDGQGLSKATRGYVRVLDRDGLADLARGFRGVPQAECARLLDDKVSPS